MYSRAQEHRTLHTTITEEGSVFFVNRINLIKFPTPTDQYVCKQLHLITDGESE
jgi:hypothetical protein